MNSRNPLEEVFHLFLLEKGIYKEGESFLEFSKIDPSRRKKFLQVINKEFLSQFVPQFDSLEIAGYVLKEVNNRPALYVLEKDGTVDSTRAKALYVYWVLKTKDFNDYIHQIDFATSVRPNMKMNYLLEYDMPIISMRQQSLFVKYIEPLTMQTYNNNSEINMLRELKAMLLTTLSH